ncbi:MAG: hypothetical protein ACM3XM_13775 [Mycobacterium leprae]
MEAEYQVRLPSAKLMFAILVPGLIAGTVLLFLHEPWVGFLVTAVFAFGTVPAIRFFGLEETYTYKVGPRGLAISFRSALGRVRERSVPWNRVTALDVRTQTVKTETWTNLVIGVEGEKELRMTGDAPGFAEWLDAMQKYLPHLGYKWVQGQSGWTKSARTGRK